MGKLEEDNQTIPATTGMIQEEHNGIHATLPLNESEEQTLTDLQSFQELRDAALENSRRSMACLIARHTSKD